jgi:type 1 glutamine amidotransferase
MTNPVDFTFFSAGIWAGYPASDSLNYPLSSWKDSIKTTAKVKAYHPGSEVIY